MEVDIGDGCFNSCAIESADWDATPTAARVARLLNWSSGQQTSTDFNPAGLAAINTTGRTQLRLGFTQQPQATAYLFINNGPSAILTVEYQD